MFTQKFLSLGMPIPSPVMTVRANTPYYAIYLTASQLVDKPVNQLTS